MNLQQLEFLRQTDNRQKHLRQQAGDSAEQAGYRALFQALETRDFRTQKTLLLQAFDGFEQALRQERRSAEPYIGLACVMWLIGKPERARAYSAKARQLNPEHSDLKTLEQLLAAQKPACHPPTADLTESEYDQLAVILGGLLSQLQPLLKQPVSPQAQTRQYLQQAWQTLSPQIQALKQRIEALEADQDCHSLFARLKLVESGCARLARHLSQCERLSHLLAQLEEQQAEIQRLQNQWLPGDAPEAKLDTLLDRADALADQLDACEQQGLPVQELLVAYEKMVQEYHKLEDVCHDETDHP